MVNITNLEEMKKEWEKRGWKVLRCDKEVLSLSRIIREDLTEDIIVNVNSETILNFATAQVCGDDFYGRREMTFEELKLINRYVELVGGENG